MGNLHINDTTEISLGSKNPSIWRTEILAFMSAVNGITDTGEASNLVATDSSGGIKATGDMEGKEYITTQSTATLDASGLIDLQNASGNIIMDTYSSAANDSFAGITNAETGTIVVLRIANNARTVTFTSSAGLKLSSSPFTLSSTFSTITLMKIDGGVWVELNRSVNS